MAGQPPFLAVCDADSGGKSASLPTNYRPCLMAA
jgi:hypothetical protein